MGDCLQRIGGTELQSRRLHLVVVSTARTLTREEGEGAGLRKTTIVWRLVSGFQEGSVLISLAPSAIWLREGTVPNF